MQNIDGSLLLACISLDQRVPWSAHVMVPKLLCQSTSTWGRWCQKQVYRAWISVFTDSTPDSKIHWANMGPIWGRQDPGGSHVGPMNLALWDSVILDYRNIILKVQFSTASFQPPCWIKCWCIRELRMDEKVSIGSGNWWHKANSCTISCQDFWEHYEVTGSK